VTVVSAYTDSTQLFLTSAAKEEGGDKKEMQLGGVAKVKEEFEASLDEEDELLYGGRIDGDTSKRGSSSKTSEAPPPPSTDHTHEGVASVGDGQTNWFVLAREDGSLEVYRLTGGQCGLVFSVRNFSSAPHTLKDSGPLLSE